MSGVKLLPQWRVGRVRLPQAIFGTSAGVGPVGASTSFFPSRGSAAPARAPKSLAVTRPGIAPLATLLFLTAMILAVAAAVFGESWAITDVSSSIRRDAAFAIVVLLATCLVAGSIAMMTVPIDKDNIVDGNLAQAQPQSYVAKRDGGRPVNELPDQTPRLGTSLLIESQELLMRRIGADLHDGPAQLIGLALLQLDGLAPAPGNQPLAPASDGNALCTIRISLQQALNEIRHLSAGLAPPGIDKLSLPEVIHFAASNHELRTNTSVICKIGPLPARASAPLKICLYRFVQEGLHNAFKHANGARHEILATSDDVELRVEVADTGPGMAIASLADTSQLGLFGLRHRVEALGGEFELDSLRGTGTRIVARFGVNEREAFDG